MKPTNVNNPDYYHKVVDCQWACPAHTDVPEYIRKIAQKCVLAPQHRARTPDELDALDVVEAQTDVAAERGEVPLRV